MRRDYAPIKSKRQGYKINKEMFMEERSEYENVTVNESAAIHFLRNNVTCIITALLISFALTSIQDVSQFNLRTICFCRPKYQQDILSFFNSRQLLNFLIPVISLTFFQYQTIHQPFLTPNPGN
jgi:hypothetical protein